MALRLRFCGADLARADAPDTIHGFTAGRNIEIELLVNNAGFGAYGYVHGIPAETMLEMVQVNCSAVIHLTRLYIPGMVERKHGDVMIVASIAGFQALPFNAVYAATKAFDLLFAEGIAEEVRQFGVNVCALCPGTTTTEFQGVAKQPDRVFRKAETAEKVARVGLEGLAQGKSYVISGARNTDHDRDRAHCAARIRRQNGREDDARYEVVGLPEPRRAFGLYDFDCVSRSPMSVH